MAKKEKYLVSPDINNKSLITKLNGFDEKGNEIISKVINEKALTIFLNNQEIVTLMSISDHPKYLAVGYLLNQNMLKKNDKITKVEIDKDLGVVVVRTKRKTNYENKLRKKITTSGCAIGTVFGDIYAEIKKSKLKSKKKIKHKWIYEISKKITLTPSLYLETGAIHGCAIIHNNKPLIYMEDVGRHNAVDKVAGWLFSTKTNPEDKILYTTGRLTSEMVVKCANMGNPALVSRSGFTAWGVELAKLTDMTLIGRLRGKRFVCLSGENRLIYDVDISLSLIHI